MNGGDCVRINTANPHPLEREVAEIGCSSFDRISLPFRDHIIAETSYWMRIVELF